MRRTASLLVCGGVILAIAGCTSRGAVENPVARNLSWYGYVAGEDVAAKCRPGARDRYRFVYNAQWGEQVRTYDILPSHTGEGATLISRTFGGGSLVSIDAADPSGPWRGAYERSRIGNEDVSRVADAFRQSDRRRAARAGDWLRSDDYWWATAVCEEGRFRFTAWTRDNTALLSLPFVAELMRLDTTGTAVRRPPKELQLGPFDAAADHRLQPGGASLQTFRLQLGENGLKLGGLRF